MTKRFSAALLGLLLTVSVASGATITRGLIGEQDFHRWDGTSSKTFSRTTSTGGTILLNDVGGEVDALMVYGGGFTYTGTVLSSACTSIGTTNKVQLVLRPGTWTVSADLNLASYTNVTFKFLPGAVLSFGAHAVNLPNIDAGPYQIFSGTGTVTIRTTSIVRPEWWGAVGNATTDDSTAVQAAVSSSTHPTIVGTYRLDTTINLSSNSVYDLTRATFYAGGAIDKIFQVDTKSNVEVIGGNFSHNDAFSPLTVIPTGTYVNTTAIHVTGSSNVRVHGQTTTEYYGSVNVYDSSNVAVYDVTSINGDAGIAVVAESATTSAIKVYGNRIIGCGDDGIAVLSRTNAFNLIDVSVTDNYIDKTRLDASVGAAVGIRVGGNLNGGTGYVKNAVVMGNQMVDMVDDGIYTHAVQGMSVIGNVVHGYGRRAGVPNRGFTFGVIGVGVSDLVVVGNKIYDPKAGNDHYIMALDTVTNATISSNRGIANSAAGFGVVYVDDSSAIKFANNSFENTALLSPVIKSVGTSTDLSFESNTLIPADTTQPLSIVGINKIRDYSEKFLSLGLNEATPSVGFGNLWLSNSAAPTTITNFTDGYVGQHIYVLIGDANTTFDFTASNLLGNAGADWTATANDWMDCIYDGTNWSCAVHDTTL